MNPDPTTVKRTLRALLLSSKHGCTPRQVLNDYQHIVGESLPYEALGYSTFLKYIESIPDVVYLSKQQDRTVLFGVADVSTQHIAKMVAKQKTPLRRRCSSMLNVSSSAQVDRAQVPHPFKLQMKTLMLSYPNGLLVAQFMEAFARRFGYYVNYRGWGYSSLDLMLKAIPDIITLEMDLAQKRLVIKRASASVVSRPPDAFPRSRATRERVVSRLSDTIASKSQGSEVTNQDGVSGEGAGGSGEKPSEKVKSKPPGINIPRKPPQESLHALDLSPPHSFAAELRSPPAPPKKPTIPRKLIGQVKELLSANPAGLWVSRFPMEFKEFFEEALPVSSLGFTSVVHLLSHLSVCELERPSGTGDWLVFTKGSKSPKVASNHDYLTEAYVSEGLVKSIHWLLRAHCNGVPLSKFSLVFQKFFNRELPVEEIGFSSVGEMLKWVPGVRVVKPPDSSLVMVFSTVEEGEEGRSDGNEEDETKLPSPAITSGNPQPSSYTRQAPPSDTNMCGVYVTNVKTPSCLSVQLIGESTTKSLEYMLEDITQFYNSKAGDTYKIAEPQIGQACCTVFCNDGYWYRAEVTGMPAMDIVEVKYVDYGNVGQVPLGSLRKPKPHYLALPAQSVNCRMANLKPAGSMWSRRSTQLVFQMTKDKPVVAIITSVKGYQMSVCLCDTNTQRDIHINDTLVSQGLAIFSPDSLEDQVSFDNYSLEPLPQGSTGDVVPEVRHPSARSQVESAPPPTVLPPQLNPQLQTYLQQLLLLQQHQLMLSQLQHNLPSSQTGISSSQTGLPSIDQPVGTLPSSSMTTPPTGTLHTSSATQPPAGTVPPSSVVQQPAGTVPPCSVVQQPAGLNSTSVALPSSSDEQSNLARMGRQASSQPPVPPSCAKPAALATQNSSLVPAVTLSSSSPSSHASVDRASQVTAAGSHNVEPSCSDGGRQQMDSWRAGQRQRSVGQRTTVNSVEQRGRREDTGDGREPFLLVRRVVLTKSHSLHVLRHNGRAFFLSGEVSQWFWDSDLLQSMLRQVQKPVWGLLLQERRASQLFHGLRRTPASRFVRYQREVTVYALDDLPLIVTTFNAPTELCEAVRREVGRWGRRGLSYFSCDSHREEEMEELRAAMRELQLKRKDVLAAMMERSNEEAALGKGPLERLLNLEQDIAGIRNRLGQLEAGSQGEHAESYKDGSTKNQPEAMSVPQQKAPNLAANKLSVSNPPSLLTWLSPLSSGSNGDLSSPSSEEQPPPLTWDQMPPHLEVATSREPTPMAAMSQDQTPPTAVVTMSWETTPHTTEVTMSSSTNHLITPQTSSTSSVSPAALSASHISPSPITVSMPSATRLTPPATCGSLTAADYSRVVTSSLGFLPPVVSTLGGPPAVSTLGGPPAVSTLGGPPAVSTLGGPPAVSTLGGPPAVSALAGPPTVSTLGGLPSVSTLGGAPAASTTPPTIQTKSVEQTGPPFPPTLSTQLSPVATPSNWFMGGAAVPGLGRGRRTTVSQPSPAYRPAISSSLMSPVLTTSSGYSGPSSVPPPISREYYPVSISSQPPVPSLTGLSQPPVPSLTALQQLPVPSPTALQQLPVPSPTALQQLPVPSPTGLPQPPAPPCLTTASTILTSNMTTVTSVLPTSPVSPRRAIGLGRGLSKWAGRQSSVGFGRGGSPNTDCATRDWQYVTHARKVGQMQVNEFPPFGSGAGLDII